MRKRVFLALLLIASLLSLIWLASSKSTASKSLTKANPPTTPSMPSKEAVSAKLATLERGWVKNEGQLDERALFSAPGYFGNTWITKDGKLLHVAVRKEECKEQTTKAQACPSKSWVISERWVGGKVQTIKGEEELQAKVSYFIGNDPSKHRSGLSTYRYVSLGEVWSGVEVKLKATQKTVEKLFYVQPGADPSKIQVQVDGAKGLKLSKDGEIIIKTGLGDLKLSKPIAWQEKDGKKLPVEVSYKLIGKNRYSFEVAKADPSLPIVIDPILQATYLGGSNWDEAHALAIHPTTGEVYVAGWTYSTDFPRTSGGAQASFGRGLTDVFVAKLNSELTEIIQSTYLGGLLTDLATALAIHPTTGEVYVAGYTNSTNFPRTSGGAQESCNNCSTGFPPLHDAFVARLSADLRTLHQSTYLGGSSDDKVNALAIHPTTGEVYVAGNTASTDFPRTSGGAQESCNNCGIIGFTIKSEPFVARLSADLRTLHQSTYLGGSDDDGANALAISSTGEVYVAGYTGSTNFPGTNGGAQENCNECGVRDFFLRTDAFVARLNSELTQIIQSTYLGGSDIDNASALAIHPTTSEIYVAGWTLSTDFPRIAGGAQTSYGEGWDTFVARLSADLRTLHQSTYLAGNNDEYITALAISSAGDIYVAGYTESTDFPNTSGGAQASCSSCSDEYYDAFVARLNSSLTQILQSTYLGGSDDDYAYALAIHPTTCDVYVAGRTESTDFPGTSGGVQESCNDCGNYGFDAFVARLTPDLAAGSGSGSGSCPSGGGGGGGGGSGGGGGGGSGGGGSGSGGSGTGGSGGTGGGGGGGGCYMTGSASSMAGLWNILVWLSVPLFALARRIRRR